MGQWRATYLAPAGSAGGATSASGLAACGHRLCRCGCELQQRLLRWGRQELPRRGCEVARRHGRKVPGAVATRVLLRQIPEGIRRGRREGKKNKKTKLTSGPHLSWSDPTFDVSGPNRKWTGPISFQPDRNWSHPAPIPSPKPEMGPSHPTLTPNQTLPCRIWWKVSRCNRISPACLEAY